MFSGGGFFVSSVELKGFKGLRSLNSLVAESHALPAKYEQMEQLSLELLIPGEYQPRKNIDDVALMELADSIRVHGVIQPLIVRKTSQGQYEIIAGERRWHAAKMAGLTHVPALVKEIKDNVAFAFALIENIQRENLNSIEEAAAFARFRDEFSMTHDEIAHMVGRSRASITNALRLLSLELPVRQMLEDGRLDMGHARALLALEPKQQVNVALIALNKQLNVRDTENLVRKTKPASLVAADRKSSVFGDKCEIWSRELSDKFLTNVSVRLDSKGIGKIVIQIDSPDEIDWLINHIKIEN